MANGFYKDCKTAPKLTIRVASEQSISTNNVFCPSVLNIDGHELTDLQYSEFFLTLKARILYWDYQL